MRGTGLEAMIAIRNEFPEARISEMESYFHASVCHGPMVRDTSRKRRWETCWIRTAWTENLHEDCVRLL